VIRRWIFRAALVLAANGAALLILAGTAVALDPGEHLYVDIITKLPGWIAQPTMRSGDLELTVLVPPGQDARNWTDQVAVETFYGPPHESAQSLLAERIAEIGKACEETALGPVNPNMENGYETAMRAVACTKVKKLDNKGEVSLYKAFKGQDRMYLVARAWRGPAFDKAHVPVQPDVTLQWLAFVQSIVLCDTRDPHKPCPTVGAAPPAKPAPDPAKKP